MDLAPGWPSPFSQVLRSPRESRDPSAGSAPFGADRSGYTGAAPTNPDGVRFDVAYDLIAPAVHHRSAVAVLR